MTLTKPFVHPLALCESESVGAGTRVWAFSHVLMGAVVGERCNLGEHTYVEQGARIGNGCTIKNGVAIWEGVELQDDVFVGPYAVFTNDIKPRAFLKDWKVRFRPTIVKRGASIGANATIVCGISIGEFAMIGAGAVVTRDVPAHALVLGNPARKVGEVCFCGNRLQEGVCPVCTLPLSQNSFEHAELRAHP